MWSTEYNMRNIFHEKSYAKCGGQTIPGPFFKNQNWVYLWINSVKFYTVCFCCMPSWGLSKFIETKLQITCFYLILRLFKKTKRGLELVPLPHFLHDFKDKYLSCYIILTDQISLSDCFYFVKYWTVVYCNC